MISCDAAVLCHPRGCLGCFVPGGVLVCLGGLVDNGVLLMISCDAVALCHPRGCLGILCLMFYTLYSVCWAGFDLKW